MGIPGIKKRKKSSRKGKKRRRSLFLHGIITILPAVLTLFILMTVVRFVQDYVTAPINSVIYWSLEGNRLGWGVLDNLAISPLATELIDESQLPTGLQRSDYGDTTAWLEAVEDYRTEELDGMFFFRDLEALAIRVDKLDDKVKVVVPPWISIVMSLLLVFVLGSVASGFVGRRVIASVDRGLTQVPIVRAVYPYAKKLVEFFLDERDFEFETVVAAPYPTENVYAIAFVTSEGMKTISEALDGAYVSLFVPTSPMPMTGYTVFIEVHRLIPLPITVDEALRVTVSAGVLIPPAEQIGKIKKSLQKLGATLEEADEPSGDEASEEQE